MTVYYKKNANPGPQHLSGYRIMWILLTFDLPVETKKQRHDASKFRQQLLDLGFEMSQLSNYMRFCNGKEQVASYAQKVEAILPEKGQVYIFSFTDKQYENIIRFTDQTRRQRQKNPNQLALF